MPFDALAVSTAFFVHVTPKSQNRKVGPIPTTVSGASTCPPACPLKEAGCYADGGPLAIFWRKVTAGQFGGSYEKLYSTVASFPAGQLWRHNVAGDLKPLESDRDTIDAASLAKLAIANRGRRGFTYTHFDPIANPANREAIAQANRAGFTVNLSGNSPAHADVLAATGAGPVVTVLPGAYERKSRKGQWLESLPDYKARLAKLPGTTPGGLKLSVCPATYTETDCAACQLCQRQHRKTVVGFPAHGFRTRKASAIAEGAA